jgi:predicted GIY-YIG superfamily endonuclease
LELRRTSPERRRFYVGQTTKEVDVRIEEHLDGTRASRAVKKDFVQRVPELEPNRKFSSKWDAESEETALGNELIRQGFDVEGPQGLTRN